MVCQSCQKNLAKVHCTEIDPVKKQKRETHLCEACAQQKGLSGPKPIQITLSELLGQLFGPNPPEELKEELSKTCPHCGISYWEFRARGRLGCPEDYEVFKQGILPLLERIHGATGHTGKSPARGRSLRELRKRLETLREEMKAAVAAERYEDAAKVRDRIRELEQEVR